MFATAASFQDPIEAQIVCGLALAAAPISTRTHRVCNSCGAVETED